MITFRAKMYNVTSGEYCDNTPTEYSFALYYGYTGNEEASSSSVSLLDWWLNGGLNQYFEPVALAEDAGQDVMLLKDGQTLTNIPYTRFSFRRSTNVGTWFEYYAKQYYDEYSAWPILRLLTSDDTESYYLEWDHAAPQGFNVKSVDSISRWEYSFQWTDSFNSQYSDDRKYNIYYSTIFCNSDNIPDLIDFSTIKYAGAFRFNDTTGGVDTLVAVNSINISVTNENCLKYEAGTFLGRAGNRQYYKLYNGTTIALFQINASDGNWKGPYTMAPYSGGEVAVGWSPYYSNSGTSPSSTRVYKGITWGTWWNYHLKTDDYDDGGLPTYSPNVPDSFLDELGIVVSSNAEFLYYYLQGEFRRPEAPPSDVDPEDIPPVDEEPAPIPQDDPDPYYDPESDPTSPSYDPVKDPTSPSYDPSVPATPYQPIIQQTIVQPAPIINPPSPVPAPETPSTYVNTSRLFTIFTPTVSQLTDFANFLWASPTDIVPTFRKIVANPMDCVLGLMVMPELTFTRQSRELNIGNIGTGITIDYAPSQFVDFDCGQLFLQEYYRSYLDYSPYTKVDIFLPFIGTRELSVDECMQKTINVSYRFDLATGNCIAFIKINGSVLYQFDGNCASHIPLSSADWGSTVKAVPSIAAVAVKAGGLIGGGPIGALGVAAAASVMSMKERHPHSGSMSGSSGLMGVLYPYLIVTRPCQALPESQNSFSGYPSFITMSLGDCSGYTEVHECHLEHVPATADELIEIERLLKEGVLF